MNVTCDKCNKRYSIADDKVRGKSVKIRCKQCQNLISVQGPAAGAGATATAPVTLTAQAPGAVALAGTSGPDPWGDERTRAMPAIDLNVQWFAMVKGKQIGPLDLKGLEGRFKLGEVTLRTYLWRQGMGDWKRAADVPEVSSVFAGVSVAQPPAPPPMRRPPPGRDVALANEMPAPEITRKSGNGNGNGNGHGHHEPAAAEAPLAVPAPARAQPKSGAFSAPAKPSTGAFPAAAKPSTGAFPAAAKPSTGAFPAAAKPSTGAFPAAAKPSTGAFPAARPAPEPEPEAAPTAPVPAPAPKARPAAAAAEAMHAEEPAGAMNLSDLFADAHQPSLPNLSALEEPQRAEEDDATDTRASDESGSGQLDPFAALGEADPSQAPPPGEATNFFIAQAGVNKRNPPWKIALFVGIPLVVLVGGAYVLQMTRLVPMEVTRTNDNGEEVKESFFSAGGVSALKDMLSGDAKARRLAAEKKKAELAERARKAKLAEQAQAANLDDAPKSNKPPDKTLQALYGGTEKSDVGPKVHKTNAEDDNRPPVAASGKWAEGANKVVGDHVKAFQLCVEEALHRNPNIRVGKVTLTLTIGTSGAVKAVAMDKFQGSDLGECISRRAKQIIFPGPEEPLDLQVPLTLGVSAGP